MNYSGFGSSDWMTPVGGFKPSRAGSEAFGDIGSKNAEMAAGFGESALSNMSAIKQAEIQADAMAKQAEAAERAGMWSALGGIAGSAITGGFSMVPKTLKVV